MADQFTPDEQRVLLIVFNTMDLNNSGTITGIELEKFLSDHGHSIGLDAAKDIVRKNGDGVGRMDFNHFCTAISTTLGKIKAVFILAGLFKELDTNNSGRITSVDLHRIVLQTGAPISHQQINNIISQCDTDGTGGISFKEFVIAISKFLWNQPTLY